MGSSQRLAAVAAVSNGKHNNNYYNYSYMHPDIFPTGPVQNNVNIFFVSASLCGVLVAVCVACWRRAPSSDKPDIGEGHDLFTITGDVRLNQVDNQLAGPPPAYDTVIDDPLIKDCHPLQEVVTDPCPRCHTACRESELPSYEAAVLLSDSKL